MKIRRTLTRIASAIALACLLSPAAALAISYSPPTFDLSADPGSVVNDKLKVKNDSADAQVITIQAQNFMGRPGDETVGVPQFYPADKVLNGRELAPWISFAKTQLSLGPGETQDVNFSINVPANADPGSHFGAILLSSTSPGVEPGVALVGNSASLVLLKVNGAATEDLKLTSFSAMPSLTDAPPVRFFARVQNEGSVHERPYGEITIRNLLGRTVATLPMNRADYKSVLPGGARRFDSVWTGRHARPNASPLERQWENFAIGPYTATLILRYGVAGQTLTAKTTFWVIPWLAILVMLTGVAILAFALKRFFGWYRMVVVGKHEQRE